MNMSFESCGTTCTNIITYLFQLYDGSYPDKKFFEELDDFIELNEVPIQNRFKLAWSGQAKIWAKLSMQRGNTATLMSCEIHKNSRSQKRKLSGYFRLNYTEIWRRKVGIVCSLS